MLDDSHTQEQCRKRQHNQACHALIVQLAHKHVFGDQHCSTTIVIVTLCKHYLIRGNSFLTMRADPVLHISTYNVKNSILHNHVISIAVGSLLFGVPAKSASQCQPQCYCGLIHASPAVNRDHFTEKRVKRLTRHQTKRKDCFTCIFDVETAVRESTVVKRIRTRKVPGP